MNVFVAGAGGAIGRRLVPLLVEAGHAVTGTTRDAARAGAIAALGATPAVIDVYDARGLAALLRDAKPEVVIHQLTDLPRSADPAAIAAARVRNARVRIEGTRNLVEAALAAGARRLVAQSIAFAYAPGTVPYGEDDPLDLAADGTRAMTVMGVVALERAVLDAPGIEGIVLRYGALYGPGTGVDAPPGNAPVHVDAAAHAALLAALRGGAGIYNVAEDRGGVRTDKARRALGWSADYRLPG